MYINAQCSRGLTPLHIAVINRNVEIILILINNGANLFIEDNKGLVTIFLNALILINIDAN